MKLTIVIPALNEEEAIGGTIERTLAARDRIITESPVQSVEVIVISDGSTDRTADIAAEHSDARLIVFEKNQGYGAAIKAGFASGTGDLVGFMDADGTCDPTFFGHLCQELIGRRASVAVGSRLGPSSKMPRLRAVGNRAYALILSLLSNRVVTDTASGMRVIRRAVLDRLYPLPDGLNFTPAMSARVLMDDSLSIIECPMPYEERIGESKLHVICDGVRFLRTIFEMALVWSPARLFFGSALFCLLAAVFLATYPFETWLRTGRLAEDMVYRLLFCAFMVACGVTLLSAGVIGDHLGRMWHDEPPPRTFRCAILNRAYTWAGWMAAVLPAIPLMIWLVGPAVQTRLALGIIEIHWSRVVLAGCVAFALVQLFVSVLLINILRFHGGRQSARREANSIAEAAVSMQTVHPGGTGAGRSNPKPLLVG